MGSNTLVDMDLASGCLGDPIRHGICWAARFDRCGGGYSFDSYDFCGGLPRRGCCASDGRAIWWLVLAVAVTVIEVALIVSVMVAAPAEKAGLARDTVFAAVMIVCNGVVGMCLFFGGARYHEQEFKVQGASAALAVLAALTIGTLILPNVATSVPGPRFSTSQLIFAGIVSLVLYASFVFVQSIRHRDYFLPVGGSEEDHAPPPSNKTATASSALLFISLVAVVGLAKVLTPFVDLDIARLNVPKAVVGIIIAGLVLLPEGLAALKAARADRLQTSLNLGLGLGARKYWPDNSRGCAHFNCSRSAVRAWFGPKRAGDVSSNIIRKRHNVGYWSHNCTSRYRAFGDIRDIRILRYCALSIYYKSYPGVYRAEN